MTTKCDEPADPVWRTRFGMALRWRVHDPDEALSIAASHRAKALEARQTMPIETSEFRDRTRTLGLESRARQHDGLAVLCERHAEQLRSLVQAAPPQPCAHAPHTGHARTDA